MRQVRDDLRDAQQLASGPVERIRGGVRGVPLRDHVVMRHIGPRETRRDEIRHGGVVLRALAVHRVEESVPRKLRVERESNEAALEPVVNGERKRVCHVRIDRGLAVAVEQIQEPA